MPRGRLGSEIIEFLIFRTIVAYKGRKFSSNGQIERDVNQRHDYEDQTAPSAQHGSPRPLNSERVPPADPNPRIRYGILASIKLGANFHFPQYPPLSPSTMAKLSFNPDVIMQIDPWLEPFLPALSDRHSYYDNVKHSIETSEGGYDKFSRGYEKFGLNVKDDGTLVYHEWAPNAVEASLIGDFSTWSLLLNSDPY